MTMLERPGGRPVAGAAALVDPPVPSELEDDPRVIDALVAYFDAVESGDAPDRSVFLAQHAEIAHALRPALEGADLLHGASPLWRQPAGSGDPDLNGVLAGGTVEGELGDFRILREIGRGGMGIVYEALQLSLGRRVALKVLPSAATLDRRLRMRFRTEALAAAHLNHPHIVPVYAVGSDRGIPFYAMQFVEGWSLQSVIHHLRSKKRAAPSVLLEPDGVERGPVPPDELLGLAPSATQRPPAGGFFQVVALAGVQAAEALEHAHGLGILHRDVKPANLLLDYRGGLWITDFGLARIQGDSGLTLTGDLVGTLRYMSPEQALGRHHEVDHRTDVYALGATLYELVTLQPLFHERDGQALLRAIAQDEPVPPRRIDPAIPLDLETIILKAIAKAPSARYASAQEMAEDLGRFVRDEPIRARRPSLVDRTARWLGRHRSVVLAVLVSSLTVLGLALASWRVREQRLRVEEDQRHQARRIEQAENAVQFALRALDVAAGEDGEPYAGGRTGVADDQRLRKSLEVFEQFERRNQLPPEVRVRVAEAYARSGDAQAQRGLVGRAEADYTRAIAILESVCALYPGRDDYRGALSTALNNLGNLLEDAARWEEAEAILRRSLQLHEALAAASPRDPEHRRQLAIRLNNLGAALVSRGVRGEGQAVWRRALAIREGLLTASPNDPTLTRDLAVSHANLGGLLLSLRQQDEAEVSFRKAVALLEGVTLHRLNTADDRALLARCYYNLGLSLAVRRCSYEAEALARKALEIQHGLAAERPDSPELQEDLARSYCSLGHALAATGRLAEGQASFEHARELREVLVAAMPEIPLYRDGLARVHLELAQILRDSGRVREAVAAYRRALEYRPDDPMMNNDLAWVLALWPDRTGQDVKESLDKAVKAVASKPAVGAFWNTLGLARYRAGQWHEAAQALRRSMELRDGGDGFDWYLLALAVERLGEHDRAREWYDMADRWMTAQGAPDADLLVLRREAQRELAMGSSQRDRASKRRMLVASGVPNSPSYIAGLVVNSSPAPPSPAEVPCRSGRGLGPSSIASRILQRSSFSPILDAGGRPS
jgi:serine/threonine protein kinase/tetratricopeptide (TPR) repeat protein